MPRRTERAGAACSAVVVSVTAGLLRRWCGPSATGIELSAM
jgi:hypothetical protein